MLSWDRIARFAIANEESGGRRWRRFVVLVLFVVGGMMLRNALGIEWSAEGVRAAVENAGGWAPIAFLVLMVFRLVLLIPSMILLPAGGLLFGVVEGSIYGTIGLTLSGLLNFGLVKWAGPEAFKSRISPRMNGVLEIARSKAGAAAVAVICGYPAGPITFIQFGAAISGMRLLVFAVAVGLGSAVRATTYSLFGASLAESDQFVWALLAIVAASCLPLLIPQSRAWIRQSFGASVDKTPPR